MADPLLTPVEFAQSIKAKYPDYAAVPDAELAARMLEKFPEYRDRVQTAPTKPGDLGDVGRLAIGQVADAGVGAVKGLGNTLFGMGKLVRDYTPVGRISDAILPGAFAQKPPEIVPHGTAQQIGYAGEQIGEFFLPTGTPGALGKVGTVALDAAKSGGLTLAQTGSPTQAGVSAALGAAIPAVVPAINALKGGAVTALEDSAAAGVMKALGPTKERYKAIAERLTPEILRRGLRGSREVLQAKAADTLEAVGTELDAALQKFGTQQVGTAPIATALETAKDAFRTVSPTTGKVVEFEPRAIKQLNGLQEIITDLGPDATVAQLVGVRRAWDKVVSQAGGFAQRAGGAIGVPLKDQSEAWAKREATGAIRKLLETEVPDLAAINKEWAFWKNLDDVVTQTLQRTQPQKAGVVGQMAEGAGQIVGGALGSSTGPATAVGGAVALGKLSKFAQTVFASPRYQLASAQAKDALATAIANNDLSAIATALGRIGAAAPSALAAQGR
jgi:hypothetical protein